MIEEERVGEWNELFNLHKSYELNMIEEADYLKLIDQLTGTKLNREFEVNFNKSNKAKEPIANRRLGDKHVIPEIPHWAPIEIERAVCHSCQIIDSKEVWTQATHLVKAAPNPFNNGTLRYVYYMMDFGPENSNDSNLGSNSGSSLDSNINAKYHNNSNNSMETIIDESKMTSFSKFNPFRKNNDSSSMTTATINNKNNENKGKGALLHDVIKK